MPENELKIHIEALTVFVLEIFRIWIFLSASHTPLRRLRSCSSTNPIEALGRTPKVPKMYLRWSKIQEISFGAILCHTICKFWRFIESRAFLTAFHKPPINNQKECSFPLTAPKSNPQKNHVRLNPTKLAFEPSWGSLSKFWQYSHFRFFWSPPMGLAHWAPMVLVEEALLNLRGSMSGW